MLLETQKGNEFNSTIPNFVFHHFSRRHVRKKAKRASGGIGIFVKSHLRESITVSHAVEHCVWVLIRNRNRDCPNINVGCVYIPPVDISYCHLEITDYYSTLGKEILGKEKAGRIIPCGDFNARTGDLTDYAETSNDLLVYHDHTAEPLKMQRFNPDNKLIVMATNSLSFVKDHVTRLWMAETISLMQQVNSHALNVRIKVLLTT